MRRGTHQDRGRLNRGVGQAQRLQNERGKRDFGVDSLKAQMHPLVLDLDAIDVYARRGGSAHADDVDPNGADAPRYQRCDALQARLRERGVIDQGEWQCKQDEHRQCDRENDPAAHQSLGEKLMSNRGLSPGREIGLATSTPTVTTGRRQRNPTPVEYST